MTSLENFWTFYRKLEAQERKYYEVIQEEAPLKLYFDLGTLSTMKTHSRCGGGGYLYNNFVFKLFFIHTFSHTVNNSNVFSLWKVF